MVSKPTYHYRKDSFPGKTTNLVKRVYKFAQGLVCSKFDLVPTERLEILIGILYHPQSVGSHSVLKPLVLSLTVFCCAILLSSPCRIVFNASPTLVTTPLQASSSFANSSACLINASKVPTLNSGMLKGNTAPLSVVTADRSVVRASS